jgi:CubicO group peptidase (beta-lactamase class C family)
MKDKASVSPELAAVFERAFAPLEKSVADKRIPGGVLGIVDLKHGRMTRAVGSAQVVPVERPMTVDTWFDLASLTKVIFTTTRILKLADEGTIDLDAPLTALLSDLRQYNAEAWERKITFRQCLGHQTPFPGVEPIYTYGRDPDLLRAFILQREWKAGPPVYSDINFILLGFALERLAKKTIRDLDSGRGFAWSADPENSAATEDCAWRQRILSGEAHDENCAALRGSGHAGLFGTVKSVLDFAESLLDGTGASGNAIALMRAPLSNRRTHGWEHPFTDWWGGSLCSPGTIGHTGFTGTSLLIDFDKGRAVTLLTNRIHPTRHFDSGILPLRQAVCNLVNQT